MKLAALTYLVRDYDEAIAWFTRVLGFALTADADMGGGKRWVTVAPVDGGTALLLARAVGDQADAIGKQAGGRVFLFLHTDDFASDHAAFTARGVRFLEAPRHEPYGTVAVFEDLYGHRWDLIQPKCKGPVLRPALCNAMR
jgi:catechol 2,3-dioxygenase-like lactoylglutathione lyase family enzyme